MFCQSLNYILGFRLSIPDFNGSISRASNNQVLLKNRLVKDAFYLSFVDFGHIDELPYLVNLAAGQFLNKKCTT